MLCHCQEIELFERIAIALEVLAGIRRPFPLPGPISLFVTGENGMLHFKIILPALPPEPNDIVSGELKVTIGGAAEITFPTTKDQIAVDSGLAGNEGEVVVASFGYVDNAGNKSVSPSNLTVTLADTIPPTDPGALALEVTAED